MHHKCVMEIWSLCHLHSRPFFSPLLHNFIWSLSWMKKGGGTNSDYYYYENQPLCLSVSLRPRLTSSDIWQDSFHSSPFRDTSNSIQFRSMAFEVFSQLHSIKYHSICYILKPDFMWGVWLATNVWVWMKLLCIFRNFSQGQKKKSWDFKNVSTNSISDQQNFLWRKCIWTENMSKGSILCCLNNSRGAFKVQAFPRGICDPITSSLSLFPRLHSNCATSTWCSWAALEDKLRSHKSPIAVKSCRSSVH